MQDLPVGLAGTCALAQARTTLHADPASLWYDRCMARIVKPYVCPLRPKLTMDETGLAEKGV